MTASRDCCRGEQVAGSAPLVGPYVECGTKHADIAPASPFNSSTRVGEGALAQGSALAVHGVAQGPFHGLGPSYRSVELPQLVLGECTPRRRRRACVVVAFEEQSDLFEGKPHLLRPGEQPNATNGLVAVSASARFAQRRREKPAAFVEPECRRSHACQRREF